ncbi:hypothetical protein J4476_04100 [Candidatus Woesearchaeota archaeon]|nr:MAG: hypothetical protein QT09_C0007G0060 [archaeon GW2011_AR18]MBS3161847.1 hypothetical protein [Candidatus Woesearchaeota archaeon]HIH25442.1 hypothetical protein [Nanoarchaeota archaeon]
MNQQLEKIVTNLAIGITAATLALGNYNCATTRVESPITSYVKHGIGGLKSECREWNEYREECLYPVVVIEF